MVIVSSLIHRCPLKEHIHKKHQGQVNIYSQPSPLMVYSCSFQDILKRRRYRKGDPSFSFTFAIFVGLIGLMVGFLLNLSLSSPPIEVSQSTESSPLMDPPLMDWRYSEHHHISSWQNSLYNPSGHSGWWKVCFTSISSSFVYWWLLQICIVIVDLL